MALQIGRSRLPFLLKKSGMSQAEYARRIGYSESMVSRIISGEKQLSLIKCKESADVLSCYMDDLYEWEIVPSKGNR